ncbi:MAG: hypothetical protein N4A43_03110 [Alphaproteobacteria bacterium]|jgi:hypothetical protein|nr:hypothetical protein [Alphaproteobacteria bacterium]
MNNGLNIFKFKSNEEIVHNEENIKNLLLSLSSNDNFHLCENIDLIIEELKLSLRDYPSSRAIIYSGLESYIFDSKNNSEYDDYCKHKMIQSNILNKKILKNLIESNKYEEVFLAEIFESLLGKSLDEETDFDFLSKHLISPNTTHYTKIKIAKALKFDESKLIDIIRKNDLPFDINNELYNNLREKDNLRIETRIVLENRVRNSIEVSPEERRNIVNLNLLSEDTVKTMLQFETSQIVQDALADYIKLLYNHTTLPTAVKSILNSLAAGEVEGRPIKISNHYKKKIVELHMIDEPVVSNILSIENDAALKYACLDYLKIINDREGKLSKDTINILEHMLEEDWITTERVLRTKSISPRSTVKILTNNAHPLVLKAGWDYLSHLSKEKETSEDFLPSLKTEEAELLKKLFIKHNRKDSRLFKHIHNTVNQKKNKELSKKKFFHNPKHKTHSEEIKLVFKEQPRPNMVHKDFKNIENKHKTTSYNLINETRVLRGPNI